MPTPLSLVHQRTLQLDSQPRRLVDLTARIARITEESGVTTGLCSLFCPHTSCGLLIQENYDPAVLRDLARWTERLAPESAEWEHDDEGPDDMPAHLRTVLCRTSETIPVAGGKLALGTWQAIYLYEHRAGSRSRQILVTVVGVTT